MVGLAIVQGVLKGVGALVSAFQATEEANREDRYNTSQYELQKQQFDLEQASLQRDRGIIETQTASDVRNMDLQRTQTVGAGTAAAAASGIQLEGSSIGGELEFQNDQFLQAISERQQFGDYQLKQNADQLAMLGIQRKSSRTDYEFGMETNRRARSAAWLNAGLGVLSAGIDAYGQAQ